MSKDFRLIHQMDVLMRKIHAAMHRKGAEIDTERIGPLGTMILDRLVDVEPASLHQLTLMMARDKSQITRAIQKLEAKGMLKRRRSPQDGRVDLLELTPKGHVYAAKVRTALSDIMVEVFEPLSKKDLQTLSNIFKKFGDADYFK